MVILQLTFYAMCCHIAHSVYGNLIGFNRKYQCIRDL